MADSEGSGGATNNGSTQARLPVINVEELFGQGGALNAGDDRWNIGLPESALGLSQRRSDNIQHSSANRREYRYSTRADCAGVVELASRVGRDLYLHVGELGFREFQLSYLPAALKKFSYDDLDTRVRRHALLMWIRGFYKTSILRTFTKKAIGTTEITSQQQYDDTITTSLWTGSFSRARLRGSVNEGRLALPLLQRPTFTLASEFLDLVLGMGEGEEMINFLNIMLEEGEARVSLNKMVGVELDPSLLMELNRRGIGFNSQEGILYYQVNTTAIFATRPVDAKLWFKLEISGLADRLNIARWHFNRRTYMEMWDWVPPAEVPEIQKLEEINHRIWNTKFHRVNAPPHQMVRDIKNILNELYLHKENEFGIKPEGGMRSARDNTNIIQLCTAFSVAETVGSEPDSQDGSYERLRYTGAVAQKVAQYLPHYVLSRMKYEHARDSYERSQIGSHTEVGG